ncbi:MAG: hypothetical protein EB127_28085 [Alphaproteobacteria bacterium]|nr:hypothetical protein [Alphaproteobacteria bacterium]
MVYSLVLEGYSATDIIVMMRKYGEALTQFSSAESRAPNQEDQALCNSNKSGVYDEMDSAPVLERDTAADINTKQQKYNIPPKLHALPPELTINKEVNQAIAIVRNSLIYKVNIELESIRHKMNENLEKTFRIHAEIANINIDSISLEDSEANISKLKSLIENISIIKASIILDQGAYRVYASIVEGYVDLSENNNTIYIEGLEQKAETTREECNNKLHLITERLKRKADSLEKSIKAPLEIMVQEELELKEYIQNFYWQLQTMEETREYFEAQKLELRKFINDIEEYNKIVTILHQNSIEYNSYSLMDAKHVPEAIMLYWDEKQQELMELHHIQAEIAQNSSNEIPGEQVNTQQEDSDKWDWLLMGNHQEHPG